MDAKASYMEARKNQGKRDHSMMMMMRMTCITLIVVAEGMVHQITFLETAEKARSLKA